MLHELSHPIRDGMPVYPGDPVVEIRPALTIDADGASVARLAMSSHTGTHVDAPAHAITGGRTMADIGLEELVGDAIVLRVPTATERTRITWSDLEFDGGAVPDAVPRIVLIDTGWARWFGDDRARGHPHLDPAAVERLWRRGMRVLAVDMLSPDPTGAVDAGFPVHALVLGGDGLIIENVRGLEALPSRVRVGFFPLPLTGDGAPVRGVAFL